MTNNDALPITEELDFAYLLSLLPPLTGESGYAWLPELFSIIGHERLLTLCKYAGGEVIRIPTIEEICSKIEILDWFYSVYISKKHQVQEIPPDIVDDVIRVKRIYDAT